MGEITARLDATEARIGESLARMEASIGGIKSELDKKPDLQSLIITVATGVVSVIGILIGVLAFGGDRFDGGVQLSSVSVQQAQDAREVAQDALAGVEEVQRQNQMILQLLQERVTDEP